MKSVILKNCLVKAIRADITGLKVDAIINAANNKLIMGGGLALVIKNKGGNQIEKEALSLGPIKIGEAIPTKAGKLPAKYVIHAATMGMDFKTDENKIRLSCRNALIAAEKLKIKSIAIPALGCGVGNFPLLASAKIIAQEVYRHIKEQESSLSEITFCLYDDKALSEFEKGAIGYLDYIVNILHWGPFVTVDTIIDIDGKVVLIKRSNPPFGWAIPGGFLDYNESLEECALRESKEETGLKVTGLKQMHTYSKPGRDPRFHTVTTVFTARGSGLPKADSDAADAKLFSEEEISKLDLAFDHADVLKDYFKNKNL